MRVMVLGGDGYIGWPLSLALLKQGHEVFIVDSLVKRTWCSRYGGLPVLALPSFVRRVDALMAAYGKRIQAFRCDVGVEDSGFYGLLLRFQPEAIVHLAEQPSAPLSMLNREAAMTTIANNLGSTMNLTMSVGRAVMAEGMPMPHIVKLGSMGEYGTPKGVIYENRVKCCAAAIHSDWLMPKQPGSWYHVSKVFDSEALAFATRMWGFRVTDINQGPVWGVDTECADLDDKMLRTSIYADELFGTVINRFCFQAAVGKDLTVYGAGGQTRGFISLEDSVGALMTVLQCPASGGEFRVINQLAEVWSVQQLARLVSDATGARIEHTENPRAEAEAHTYQPEANMLSRLGWMPKKFLQTEEIERIVGLLSGHGRSLITALQRQPEGFRAFWRKAEHMVPTPQVEENGSGI